MTKSDPFPFIIKILNVISDALATNDKRKEV